MDVGPRAIRVEPYTDAWAQAFSEEAERLGRVFRDAGAQIEHIGSTSVAGLDAKPIVDVLVGVERLEDAEDRIGAMEDIGYEYVAKYESEIPDRRYFRRPRSRPRRYHVHCVRRGGRLWTRHLGFRDHLRAHPDDAAAYGALKRDLAERSRADRDSYLEGKAPFIEKILERAGLP